MANIGNSAVDGFATAARVLVATFGDDAFYVGGTARARLTATAPKDYDAVVLGMTAEEVVARLSRSSATDVHEMVVGDRLVGARGFADGLMLEVAPQDGADLTTDLRRRVLTVDAIAVRVSDDELVDPFGGAADLAAGRLGLTAVEELDADPFCAARAVRQAVELDLEIRRGIISALAQAVDRMRREGLYTESRLAAIVFRLAESASPVRGWRLAGDLGILDCLGPGPAVAALERAVAKAEAQADADLGELDRMRRLPHALVAEYAA